MAQVEPMVNESVPSGREGQREQPLTPTPIGCILEKISGLELVLVPIEDRS